MRVGLDTQTSCRLSNSVYLKVKKQMQANLNVSETPSWHKKTTHAE